MTVAETGPWSLGTVIAVPIILASALLLIALGRYLWHKRSGGDSYDKSLFTGLAGISFTLAVAFIGGVVLGMYPYNAEYHQWREVSGTVESVDSRISSNSQGTINQRYAVIFKGSDGDQYGCDDARCASADEGDVLTLSCKREWQYTGTDGYGCRFDSLEGSDE